MEEARDDGHSREHPTWRIRRTLRGKSMEVIAWILAAGFGVLSLFLALRARGRSGPADVGSRTQPLQEQPHKDATSQREESADQALRGMARYLKAAVLEPLEKGLETGELRRPVEDAVDALKDLAFHASSVPEGTPSRENLVSVIQAVTREFTLETGTPVKFRGPDTPVPVVVAAERFKDGLYLLLANAGHFGGGQTVEVSVEAEGDPIRVRIGDRGSGFSEEAIRKAFEPFWTTESDALGLGLPRAKRILERQGAAIAVGNRPAGGGEVVVSLRRPA